MGKLSERWSAYRERRRAKQKKADYRRWKKGYETLEDRKAQTQRKTVHGYSEFPDIDKK